MHRLATAGAIALAQMLVSPSAAQIQVVEQAQIPAGNPFGPHTPASFFFFPPYGMWHGDEDQGFRHDTPLNPAAPFPYSDQQFQFDTAPEFSVGGGTECLLFCSVGQVSVVTPTLVALAVYDHGKTGQPGKFGGGGVYLLQVTAINGCPPQMCPPIGSVIPMAPSKGLAGNEPTAVAYGPDGKVYVGFLKTPSYVRVAGTFQDNSLQTVESVGNAPKPVFGMAFSGVAGDTDLYMVTGDGFYVVRNVTACTGNANGCGAPKLIWNCAGECNGIAADGKGNIYFAQHAAGAVFRYQPPMTPSGNGTVTAIASGFAFAAGHTNGLGFDPDGNLWVGHNPLLSPTALPEGAPNSGQIVRIPAAALPN